MCRTWQLQSSICKLLSFEINANFYATDIINILLIIIELMRQHRYCVCMAHPICSMYSFDMLFIIRIFMYVDERANDAFHYPLDMAYTIKNLISMVVDQYEKQLITSRTNSYWWQGNKKEGDGIFTVCVCARVCLVVIVVVVVAYNMRACEPSAFVRHNSRDI